MSIKETITHMGRTQEDLKDHLFYYEDVLKEV